MTSALKGLIVRASIDKLVLSSSTRGSNPFLKGDLPGYDYEDSWKIDGTPKSKLKSQSKNSDGDKRCKNYRWQFLYLNHKSGNRLILCVGRRGKNSLFLKGTKNRYTVLPSMIVSFNGSYVYPLIREDVEQVLDHLNKKQYLGLRISEIHLAIDLISPRFVELHERVCKSILAGKKGKPRIPKGTDTRYYGSTKSPVHLVIYNKSEHLANKKSIYILKDVSRVEARMKVTKMNNFVSELDDLKTIDWESKLYRSHLSFHQPNRKLKAILKGECDNPIYEMQAIMEKRFGTTRSNFNRDYLDDHKYFAEIVRTALTKFKW